MARTVSGPDDLTPIFDMAEDYVQRYFAGLQPEPERGQIEIFGERYILLRAASMSVDFFETVQRLYRDKGADEASAVARSLLFDISHAIGAEDARNFHRKMQLDDPVTKAAVGPVFFAHMGWAFVELLPESRQSPNDDLYIIYNHRSSFEADAWLQAGKQPDFPVCIMNAGYSSGWTTESFGVPVVAVEVACKALGDAQCRFIMAPPTRIEAHVHAYLQQQSTMVTHPPRYEIPGFFQRKQVEDELRDREEQYRGIFEATSDAVLIVDVAGTIVAANPAAYRLYGYDPGTMVGLPAARITPPGSGALFQAIKHGVTTAGEFCVETVGVRNDASTFDIDLCATAFRYQKQPHLLLVIRDISERKRAEADRLRLQQQILEQNERMRNDLALARNIQLGLLPNRTPWHPGLMTIASRSLPAYEVGGDFYSYVALDQHRVGVAIGDISGKGVSAALLMALTTSLIEAHAGDGRPGQLLATLNRHLANQLQACRMFAALLYTVIDFKQRMVCFANGGMIAPFLIRDRQVRLIEVGGLPLGMLGEAQYDEQAIEVRAGDVLVLVSDGVVEARNVHGELFGFERLQRLLEDSQGFGLEQMLDHVLADIAQFTSGAELQDDMTIIALRPHLTG